MCGFPIGQLDKFLEKLVRENNRFVAICDEHKHYDAEGNFKYITRRVVRVVTPGTRAMI
jgi:DNA mismatch repair ATPase MutS